MNLGTFILIICFGSYISVHGQHPVKVDTEDVFIAVEQMPEYPGGIAELGKYLQKNIRLPQNCLGEGKIIVGKFFISFVVTETGGIRDIEVKPDYACPEQLELLSEIVKDMPRWRPGLHGGKPVAVRYSLPMCIYPGYE